MATKRRLGVKRQSHLLLHTRILHESLDNFRVIPLPFDSDIRRDLKKKQLHFVIACLPIFLNVNFPILIKRARKKYF